MDKPNVKKVEKKRLILPCERKLYLVINRLSMTYLHVLNRGIHKIKIQYVDLCLHTN